MIITSDTCPIYVGDSLSQGPVELNLISEAHALITGQTRSGKSIWCYSLLSQLAMYPHVRVVGVDYSQLLLRPFAKRIWDPWICMNGDDIAGTVAMMQALKAEMDRRNRLLSETMYDKFSDFSSSFPLIVAVFEEFPGIIHRVKSVDSASTDRKKPKLAPQFLSLLSSLVAESAKAGIRIILIAQRPDADIIGGAARENIPVRIAFRQASLEAYRMMYPDVESQEVDAVRGQPPGVGMIETPRLTRRVFKGPYVTAQQYLKHVLSCDLDYLRNLQIDREFRLEIAATFPIIGDPG